MKPRWTVADLIDFHFFAQRDQEELRAGRGAEVTKRDRRIYLAKIEPQLGPIEDISPRLLVHRWLRLRRLQYQQEPGGEHGHLPGSLWSELALLCQVLVLACGLLSGGGLAGSLLLYTGKTPLNVAVYFGLLVAGQVALIGCQGVLLGFRRARRIPFEATGWYLLLGRLLLRAGESLRRLIHPMLTSRQRLNLSALVGGVRQRRELAVLLIWPAFALVQLGGIGFNLGVLTVTLAKVTFSDIAFAWQSSLAPSADLVTRLVHWIALPWAWALPWAVPSLEQIQGSQIILKEGMSQLQTNDLLAWWPFLCCAVAVYGLLPRCLLLLLGLRQQQRALDQLHFATPELQDLVRRMTVPQLTTNGLIAEPQAAPAPIAAPGAPTAATAAGMTATFPAPSIPATQPPTSTAGRGAANWWLLLPDELDGDSLRQELGLRLQGEYGGPPLCLRYGLYGEDEATSLAPLATAATEGGLAGVAILQEAWQPPLKETEALLRQIRALVGDRVPMAMVLIGRPAGTTILTPVPSEQLAVWDLKMRALGDGLLSVRPLVPS